MVMVMMMVMVMVTVVTVVVVAVVVVIQIMRVSWTFNVVGNKLIMSDVVKRRCRQKKSRPTSSHQTRMRQPVLCVG